MYVVLCVYMKICTNVKQHPRYLQRKWKEKRITRSIMCRVRVLGNKGDVRLCQKSFFYLLVQFIIFVCLAHQKKPAGRVLKVTLRTKTNIRA